MPNLRSKTWTTTTPAYVEDAQFWEDHLISAEDAAKAQNSVQSVNSQTPDENGNVDIVALPAGGTAGQVLTKLSSTAGDADWEDPASSGHVIQNASGVDMTYRETLQFINAEVSDDALNEKTVVDCQGEKGDKGDAATIQVGTVTTLPAGSPATVTNVGSTSAAIFDFAIPQGQDGTGATNAYKYIQTESTTFTAVGEDTIKFEDGDNIIITPKMTGTTKTIEISATYPAVDVPDVINTLTSTSTTDALSAYQGNLLNAAVLLKQDELTPGNGIVINSTSATIGADFGKTSGKVAEGSDLDEWIGPQTVNNGAVSFTGLNDVGVKGYDPYFIVTSTSTNLKPYAYLTSISGEGTNNMSLTFETDADAGASCYLRYLK